MPRHKLTQEEFDKIFSGHESPDSCAFPDCDDKPRAVIRKKGRDYGICEKHLYELGESDIEIHDK